MFGNSPDETAYCRLYLNRETVGDAMTMIQPQLLSYGMGVPPEPVLLDVSSIQARVLRPAAVLHPSDTSACIQHTTVLLSSSSTT